MQRTGNDSQTRSVSVALVLLVTVIALVYPVAYTYIYFVLVAHAPQSVQQAVYSGGKVVQFSLPALWAGWLWLRYRSRWRKFDEGTFSGAAEPAPHWSRGRSITVGLGFALLTVAAIGLLGGLWLLPAGYLDLAGKFGREKLAGFGITTAGQYIVLGTFYSVVHSLLEEYYWRWFAFRLVRRFAPLLPAAVIGSLAFAAHHFLVLGMYFGWASPLTWLTSGSVTVGGIFWCWLYERSGRLWVAWLSHMVIDIGVFGMGYWMILAPK